MKTIACFSVWVMLASGFVKGDEVTDWNHIMLTAMLTPPVTPTPVATRTAAIFQSAVFDAANGVDPRYKPIYVPPGNAVTDWSAIASTTIVKNGGKPAGASAVWCAYTSLAVYDAVNAITGEYRPFYYHGAASPDASVEAGTVTAAHRLLVNYFPAQQPRPPLRPPAGISEAIKENLYVNSQ